MANKTVVVIGGSSGIGFEVSNQLRTCDANLIIVGRNQNRLNEASQKLETQVVTKTLDAHNEIELEKKFSRCWDQSTNLVSMIGDSMSGGFLTTSKETMRHVIHSKFIQTGLLASSLLLNYVKEVASHLLQEREVSLKMYVPAM